MRAEAVAPGTGRRTLETGSCNPWIGSERGGPTPSWPFPCNPCNPWMALGYGDPTSPWPRPCPTNRTVAGRVLRQSLCFGLIRSKPGQSQSKSVKAGQSDFDYYFLQPHGPKPTQTDSIRPNPTAGGGVAMGNVIAVSMARSKHSMRGTRAMQLLRLSMNLSMQTSREVDRVLRTRLRLRSENTVSGSSLSRSRRDFFRLSAAIAFGERDPPSAVPRWWSSPYVVGYIRKPKATKPVFGTARLSGPIRPDPTRSD